jgi:hypothetical protein
LEFLDDIAPLWEVTILFDRHQQRLGYGGHLSPLL